MTPPLSPFSFLFLLQVIKVPFALPIISLPLDGDKVLKEQRNINQTLKTNVRWM